MNLRKKQETRYIIETRKTNWRNKRTSHRNNCPTKSKTRKEKKFSKFGRIII